MNLLHKYYEHQIESEAKWGKKSVILYEVGSFYEIYGVKTDKTQIGDIEKICNILGIICTQKNKKEPHNKTNPFMAGFPNYVLHKHLKKLIDNNYIVSIYNQHDINNTKKKERKMEKIYSITNYIENEMIENIYLCSIYLENYISPIINKKLYSCFISIIDLSTGKNLIFEYHENKYDERKIYNEINRIINNYDIKEIIICKHDDLDINTINKIIDNDNIKKHYKEYEKEYKKIEYQKDFLKKIFKKEDNILNILEILNLSNFSNELRYSYLILLQFSYEFDNNILNNIHKPSIINLDNKLQMNKDSIYQLNLINNKIYENKKSLYDILNKTNTNMGSRYLREILLTPITDIEILNERYNLIEELIKKDKYKKYIPILKNISDLEKKYRKICLVRIEPWEFANLQLTFDSISLLLDLGKEDFNIKQCQIIKFKEFLKHYNDTFNFSIMKNISLNNITDSFFKDINCDDIEMTLGRAATPLSGPCVALGAGEVVPGGTPPDSEVSANNNNIDNEINKCQNQINKINIELKQICTNISNYIEKNNNNLIKLEYSEKELFYLSLTSIRYDKLIKILNKNNTTFINEFGQHTMSNNINKVKLKLKIINEKSNELIILRHNISNLVKNKYLVIIKNYVETYNNMFIYIINLISYIDVFISLSDISHSNKYNKPKIQNINEDKSYFKIYQARHPIIEKIEDNNEYITNDFDINNNGTLIFGINSSGKSSFLRSIGINIILAQIGCYTSCEKLVYYPFKKLISKITLSDNFYEGKSLFINEMSDLKNMFENAGENTLIIADELCSGTTLIDALSILYSTINKLIETQTNFIFTSHFHEILKLDNINNNNKLKIQHFKTEIDGEKIIFHRKLLAGSGDHLYGLELCKFMNFDKDFIKNAYNIRNNNKIELIKINDNKILSTKTSKYNSKLYIHECFLCKNKDPDKLETHHISPQELADTNGYIDNFHKNKKFNLVILCKTCHKSITFSKNPDIINQKIKNEK